MKKIRVGINGFGRIGRAFMRIAATRDDIEVVGINDLGDIENLAYLLKYDSVYKGAPFSVSTKKVDWRTLLVVNDETIPVYMEKDPTNIPWGELKTDVVIEATGHFTDYAKAKAHLDAGAKRVVISAPPKGTAPEGMEAATILLGVNEELFEKCQITSNGSCTTNATSPVVAVLNEKLGIEKALLNTVHSYTATQQIVDGEDAKDWRRGRAAAQNIVPSTTGAAQSVTEAVTDLKNKFDGISLRIPLVCGSIADITFIASRETTVEEVNQLVRESAQEDRWKGVLAVSDEQLVSSDIIGSPYAAIVDTELTKVVGGNLVKVLSWYDNEMGYTHTLVEHVLRLGRRLG